MIDELSPDLIGTNPKYPKIVNQNWLNVNKETYDNYPSDNNPVRIQPKLSEIWNTDDKGPQVLPNMKAQPMGLASNNNESEKLKASVIKTAKKAMMEGLKGSGVSKRLKSLYTPDVLKSAQEDLKKLASEEMGLLGNVYIDASAFENYDDAESFMKQHRNRLARDLLYKAGHADPAVVAAISKKFRKNVVSNINYNEKLFGHYKEHLVLAGQIPKDFEIDSKETLRQAFLKDPEKKLGSMRPAQPVKKLSSKEISEGLKKISEENQLENKKATDQMRLAAIRPVISFIQENLSKGKTKDFLKEMIRQKFSNEDIQAAANCVAITISENGLDQKHIDNLINDGKISSVIGEELKKIGKKWPVKKSNIPEFKQNPVSVGVPGYMYTLSGRRQSTDKLHQATVIALRKGTELDNVRSMLNKRLSNDETEKMLSSAMDELNSIPAGVVANKAKNTKTAIIVEDPNKKEKLPPAKNIPNEVKAITDFYKGSNTDIDVKQKPEDIPTPEIDLDFNRAGIDESLS